MMPCRSKLPQIYVSNQHFQEATKILTQEDRLLANEIRHLASELQRYRLILLLAS